MGPSHLFLGVLCLINYKFICVVADIAILTADPVSSNTTTSSSSFCVTYNPKFKHVPSQLQQATRYTLYDARYSLGCDHTDLPSNLHNMAVEINRGNCTFVEKAVVVQSLGAGLVVIVSDTDLPTPHANNESEYKMVNISIALLDITDSNTLHTRYPGGLTVSLSAPDIPKLDVNMLIMWFLSVGTITLGGVLAVQPQLRKQRKALAASIQDGRSSAEETDKQELPTVALTGIMVIPAVVMIATLLVLMYYFYSYMVYLVIAIFALASWMAFISLLHPAVKHIPFCDYRPSENNLPLLRHRPTLKDVLLVLSGLGIVVWWVIVRNESYAWVLQDTLGIIFCLNMLKTLRLPNLKVCTMLLVVLFVYDVVFVFITPLFTKNGTSIMEQVATGGDEDSSEQVPLALKLPRLLSSPYYQCFYPYSLLGFGDIIIPGLLVVFCHSFDIMVHTNRIYFIGSVIAYGVGMLITFLALALMNTGQPALLYLVPCTVITTLVIGLKRGELGHLWSGELVKVKGDSPVPRGPIYSTNTADVIIDNQSTDLSPILLN